MTITNHASDGLYPELITLFRAVAEHGPLRKDELIRICTANSDNTRIRATLTTWTDLGVFSKQGDDIDLDPRFVRKRGETLEDRTEKLPAVLRELLFNSHHALPLWPASGEVTDEGTGRTGDFVRELSWTLAQDIYSFPFDSTEDQAVSLEARQIISSERFIFKNKSRWSGVGFWARYTGFAAADRGCIDPTSAIRAELGALFQGARMLPAGAFLRELSARLPVLDFGIYRTEVERALKPEVWPRPPEGQLSTSLSFALRRLQLDRVIDLSLPADAGESLTLSGRNFRPWHRFSQVEFLGSPS